MSSSAAAPAAGASAAKADDDSSSQLRTLLDRPGRSFNFPLSHYSLPRVVAQNLTDENGRALRIPVRLHLSHRVLTYMRNKIWSLKLPDRASFSSEPVDGERAALVRQWLDPAIVYYSGSQPIEFVPEFSEKRVMNPIVSIALNLGDPDTADEETNLLRAAMKKEPLPPLAAHKHYELPRPFDEPPWVLEEARAAQQPIPYCVCNDVVICVRDVSPKRLDIERALNVKALETRRKLQELFDLGFSEAPGMAVILLMPSSLPLTASHCSRPFRLKWWLPFSDNPEDVEEVVSRTFEVIKYPTAASKRGETIGQELSNIAGPVADSVLAYTERHSEAWYANVTSGIPAEYLERHFPRSGCSMQRPYVYVVNRLLATTTLESVTDPTSIQNALFSQLAPMPTYYYYELKHLIQLFSEMNGKATDYIPVLAELIGVTVSAAEDAAMLAEEDKKRLSTSCPNPSIKQITQAVVDTAYSAAEGRASASASAPSSSSAVGGSWSRNANTGALDFVEPLRTSAPAKPLVLFRVKLSESRKRLRAQSVVGANKPQSLEGRSAPEQNIFDGIQSRLLWACAQGAATERAHGMDPDYTSYRSSDFVLVAGGDEASAEPSIVAQRLMGEPQAPQVLHGAEKSASYPDYVTERFQKPSMLQPFAKRHLPADAPSTPPISLQQCLALQVSIAANRQAAAKASNAVLVDEEDLTRDQKNQLDLLSKLVDMHSPDTIRREAIAASMYRMSQSYDFAPILKKEAAVPEQANQHSHSYFKAGERGGRPHVALAATAAVADAGLVELDGSGLPKSMPMLPLKFDIPQIKLSRPPTRAQIELLANIIARVTTTVGAASISIKKCAAGKEPIVLRKLRARLSMLKRRMRIAGSDALAVGLNPQSLGIFPDGSVDLAIYKWGLYDESTTVNTARYTGRPAPRKAKAALASAIDEQMMASEEGDSVNMEDGLNDDEEVTDGVDEHDDFIDGVDEHDDGK